MAADTTRDHVNRRLRCLLHCALHQRTINLTCPQCNRTRRLDAVALWWFFERRGQDDAIPAVFQRFYCRTCQKGGQKIRPRWAITDDPIDEKQPPYPDRYEWKRQINRYRS